MLRTEEDSQDLTVERDTLLKILAWYDQSINLVREGLIAKIEGYNRLVQDHVAKRDKQGVKDGSVLPPTTD